ncbi:hypothetical protein Msil_1019 [Methylocella silvestris BL2]|uniref:Uncharacterized protein n=1 Tax=Methylocella silvestris (strain DSM 15510 / CIP 108128 / LMG 27833 / NCIMB 13906 / BL2) TaxID=395965 RepID=B8ELJ4_METSB|nr:hypothetical protein Msil_1019 [Methylocella silvestris BL2]
MLCRTEPRRACLRLITIDLAGKASYLAGGAGLLIVAAGDLSEYNIFLKSEYHLFFFTVDIRYCHIFVNSFDFHYFY